MERALAQGQRMEAADCKRQSSKRARWLALAGAAAISAGSSGCILTTPSQYVHNCFKLGPNYASPSAPLADQWILSDDPRVQNRHLQDWWRVFQDPKLNSLIDTAYRQNLNLRVLGTR